jgi:hypothetical protein
MGAAPGPCPAWRPRAPGPGLELTPWPPPEGEGIGGARVRAGGGAGRGSQRCEARARGWSCIRGGVWAPTRGPELLEGVEPEDRRGARAGHPSATSRGGRGVNAPGVQATAPLAPNRGKPRDPEVHFRGRRSLAWGSAFAPLLPVPAQGGGRKKEPRAASLQWRMRPIDTVKTRKRKTRRQKCASAEQ